MVHAFYKNMIAFLIGFLFVSELFSSPITLEAMKGALFIGYITLSIYHAVGFAISKFSFDMFSMVLIWLLPVVLLFIIFISMVYGMIASVPKALYSGFVWNKERKQKKATNYTHTNQRPNESPSYNQQVVSNQVVRNEAPVQKEKDGKIVPFSPR